ncbi:MarR family winged helix-turn-helix transcriptional regulator [Paeniglutamicibacter psychrophenolicus]|uniref:MarR family winged helix-turn-helix transcriptional regulator n=1 Tax=Paeniglutamicibacter psychrophenolicus TaxID=257454 RepID=UPI00278359F4|nr:MarR family transcriptional regulator [Paeniglutamicibacter psychrophenolicus]MDQ0093827.1 DNA-binding PadR family transcriptional regulator [Paeniglutamicibacter psychrophenolicus]
MTDSRPLGYWLKLVDSLISEQFANSLEEHGVTRRQWQLLNVLSLGPATGGELTAALAPFFGEAQAEDEPTSPSEHLAELVESGWIAEEGHTFTLTERGAVSLDRLTEIVDEMREESSSGISTEEYATTVDSLKKMAVNLGWDPDKPPADV